MTSFVQRVGGAQSKRTIGSLNGCGLSGVLLSAALYSQTALAAEQSATASANVLEEITVTAEFRKENLQQTPIAITTVNAEMMEARGDANVVDVGNRAPNVTLTPAASIFGNAATASIRGVGQYDPSFALDPGVGIYVDDVYHGTLFGSMLDLLDLERVEVLRGPQGILAGKNSIGGAIKLFSQPPSAAGGGYVGVAYGSFDRINVKASASFALIPDSLLVRISGVSKKSKGFFTNYNYSCANPGSALSASRTTVDCEVGQEGGQDLSGARLAVRWILSDSIENSLIASNVDDQSQSAPNKLLYADNPSVTSSGVPFDSRFLTGPESYSSYATYCGDPADTAVFCVPNRNTLQAWEFANTLDLKFTDTLALKSITGVQGSSGNNGADIDGSPIDIQTSYNTASTHQFTQELRLSGNLLNDSIEWTLGGFYFRSSSTAGGRLDLNYSSLDFLSDDRSSARNSSGFAHAKWRATDKLTANLGLRYTKESKEYIFNRFNPDGTIPSCGVPGCAFNYQLFGQNNLIGTYDGSHTDYRAGVDYQWGPDIMTYAQVSTGYKGGGVNPRPFFTTQLVSFKPETLTAYEIGMKSDFFDNRVRVNLAAFYSQYKDIQQNVLACDNLSPFPGAPCALPVNAGDADIKGVELETQMRLTRALIVDGSLSYLDFKYTRVNPTTGITQDMITPYTPERKASVGIEYQASLASGVLTPRVDWTYQSEIFTNSAVNTPYNRVAGYALTNLRLGWTDAEATWEGAIAVSNLFDKFYYLNKIDNHAAASGGYVVAQPGRPREWLLSLKRNF